MIGIHAPSPNFVTAKMIVTIAVATEPDAVDHDAALPVRLAHPQVVLHHARLRQRERGEHADRVERDQRVGLAAEDDDQHRRERPRAR